MKHKIFPRTVAYAGCAILALTSVARAQNVQVQHDPKDSKAAPITQETEPLVHFILETGYTSEYNFRGTNLMPGSDGGALYSIQATVPKVGPGALTLQFYAIHQIGSASANTWSVSEGGGSGGITSLPGQDGSVQYDRFPKTIQTSFQEFDLVTSYKFPIGPIDVTLGNILFLIHRDAQTFETDVLPVSNPQFIWIHPPTFSRFRTVGPEPTVEDETFDRIYVRLSTTKLCPHITPQITYYQTLYNEGDQPTSAAPFFFAPDSTGFKPHVDPGPNNERNEELGGYLEGKIAGNFPVGKWLEINPYGLVSYSFRDRTEPVAASFGGRPLTGFNHAQAGLELNFHIAPHIDLSPQVAYAYHISEPPIGTNKNEYWGGVKLSVSLP